MGQSRPERLIGVLLVLAVLAVTVVVVLLNAPEPATRPGGPVDGVAAHVEHVIDGDTIVVTVDGARERVRYIGLDAPEIADPSEGTPAECGGEAARSANLALVDGSDVLLERDESDRDRFGRLLRHVWIGSGGAWSLVGERLIERGMVEARSYPPDTARDGAFDAAERSARDAGSGIWSAC